MQTVEIAKAAGSDLPEILALQYLAFQETVARYNMTDIPPLKQTLDELIEESKTHVILKAVADSKIIGSVRGCLHPEYCYIGRLIVHPDYQNRGVGKRLMETIENEFDADKYGLTTGHLDEKNIYLYKKLGYEIKEREKVGEDLYFIHMVKNVR